MPAFLFPKTSRLQERAAPSARGSRAPCKCKCKPGDMAWAKMGPLVLWSSWLQEKGNPTEALTEGSH